MKKITLAALATLLSLMLLLSGCGAIDDFFDDEDIRGYTVTMLDALIENDITKAHSTIPDLCTEEQFTATFKEMRALLEGVESYTISTLSFNKSANYTAGSEHGITTAQYRIETDKETAFVINVEMQTGVTGLSAFYITPEEMTDLYYTGTLGNMADASLFQWMILLLNLVVIAVTVLAIIDCSRKKIKLKALWIVIIVLGMLLVSSTVTDNSSNFNINLGLFTYSALVIYGSGKTMLRLLIPVGAIVYFAVRGKLIKKDDELPPAPPYPYNASPEVHSENPIEPSHVNESPDPAKNNASDKGVTDDNIS